MEHYDHATSIIGYGPTGSEKISNDMIFLMRMDQRAKLQVELGSKDDPIKRELVYWGE